MTSRKKIEVEAEEKEGWEALSEEESGGVISPSSELEEALREAAEALDETGRKREDEALEIGPAQAASEGEEGLALELKQSQDRLLRLQADFENFRRRSTKERLEVSQYGHQNLVKDLLATVDNLERAIGHARESGGGDLENLLQGVELVQRELLTALGKHGVTRVEAVGKPFDPAVHEAMAQAPDASVEPNTVIKELQTGYQLRDRLLRPSRVIVAKAPEGAAEPAADPEVEPAPIAGGGDDG
ncbi:MAG: nucleotide exchange factor GrpE [Myxococcota bacterium]